MLMLCIVAAALVGVSRADDAPTVDAEAELAQAIRAAAAAVAPAVLRIETFGGLEKVDGTLVSSGPATALAVARDGHLITSAYAFANQPTSILVTLPSGKRAAAAIVARDRARGLVLLKVNSEEELTPPVAVPRSEMSVGQTAIAVGRTYEKDATNLSVGIVSATDRIWGKALQTDAKISPSNYGGPLIDLEGRVLGVLVPMSPQGDEELAGAEWYDSGIGFAVPLAEIYERLDTLKAGKDLQPGKLGTSLKGEPYTPPIEIAALLPGSPAAKAGLKKGDIIVEIDGTPVAWQSQMRHVLGPHYAGDKVSVVVKRGDERVSAHVELAAEIPPYDIPFLGILPLRDALDSPTKVRYVFPHSPAEKAGVKIGDEIRSVGGSAAASPAALRDLIGTHDRAASPNVEIEIVRDRQPQKLNVTPGSLPTEFPDELPAALSVKPAADEQPVATGVVDIKLPEDPNNCFAFVPPSYNSRVSHGLVIALHAPGKFSKADLEPTWGAACAQHDLIVLAPEAAKKDGWDPTEAEFVRKAIDDVLTRYNIDRTRIVVHGHQAGGTFGHLVAFGNLDVIRGLSTVDAPLPRRVAPPESDPVQRFAFCFWTASESQFAERITAAIKALGEKKLPVTVRDLGKSPRVLSDVEIGDLARWIDSLDRI